MASFTQRGGKWRALVRRRNTPPISRTFRLKSDAERWARDIEDQITSGVAGNLRELRYLTVGDVLTRYKDEVSPHKKGWKFENDRIKAFLREPWARLDLTADIPAAIRAWRDRRLQEVKPETVRREIGLLGPIFTHAITEWGVPLSNNPIHQVKRPVVKQKERDRLWSDADLQIWLDHLGFDEDKQPTHARDFLGWVLLIARRTGLRLGEICRICIVDIDMSVPMIRFGDTKNGDAFDCPIRSDASSIIKKLLKHRERETKLIAPNEGVIGEFFRRERKLVAVAHPTHANIVIHSLRHTYTTEMVARVPDKMVLLRITGRRTLQSLARYYKPAVSDLARMMG